MSKTSRSLSRWFHRVALWTPFTEVYDRIRPLSQLGRRGELAAERFLLKQGYIILARGYEDSSGELDLIAVDDETIVFVEVKTRSNDLDGSPAEAVDDKKQQRMTKTALGYLKWHRLTEYRWRFDIIAIVWPSKSRIPDIRHFENAFEPVGQYQLY